MGTLTAARSYYRDLSWLSRQVTGRVLRLWRTVDRSDMSRSWLSMLPHASAIVVAGQTVAAELADPYLVRVLDEQDPRWEVNPEAFAGATPDGDPIGSLLYLPVIDAKQRIAAGVSVGAALREAQEPLTRYAHTTVEDAGRLAVAAGMGARPHAVGWYRMLQPPSCARCAILAGRYFRYNTGFDRHDKCDCVHIPVQEADDSLLFDARKAIEAGQVRGLSRADTRAVVEFGADPSQVVNAKRGMYRAGGRTFTTTGTTRRGVAGARILARDMQRTLAGIESVRDREFRNFTFDRLRAAEYAELFRQGTTSTRLTRSGRVQSYAYRFARSPRPTPEQILADAPSRDEARRLLINNGYIL
ncbi:VG15 protein [Micromonospora rubida]